MHILGYGNNRIHVRTETFEEDKFLKENALGVSKRSDASYYSLEINWFNDKLLGTQSHEFRTRQSDVATSQLNPELKHYQMCDVAKMLGLRASLNRNKMGFGKTVEAIEHARVAGYKSILVVCPKSVRRQWIHSFRKWYPGASDLIRLDEDIPTSGPCIVVTNYERLYDSTRKELRECYRRRIWDVCIADEAHRIKNTKSIRTRMMLALPCKHKVALTGTPIMNRPDDLYSILHWLSPYYSGGSYWNFVNKFCKVEEGYWGRKIAGATDNEQNLSRLRELLQEVSIYNDVEITEGQQQIDIPIEMTPSQKKMYKATLKNSVKELMEEGITLTNGLSKLLTLCQISSNPGLYGLSGGNPKFEWIHEVLEDNPDLNIVVFSRFARTVYALRDFLDTKKIPCVTYTGADNLEDREAGRDKFSKGEVRVIIGTIAAMGEGVDGLQNNCHTVIFIDRDWNPELMKQAANRVDRFGQTQRVNVFNLMCEGVDERIAETNIQKLEDIMKILEVS